MNWLVFYLVAFSYPFMYLWVGYKAAKWPHRIVLWTLISVPPMLYAWPYFAIKREHERMCEAEGGMKVLVQPGKADRVRVTLENWRGKETAESFFQNYFPQAMGIEMRTKRRGADGKLLSQYDAFTAKPNPGGDEQERVGSRKKQGSFLLTVEEVEKVNPNVFEISSKVFVGKNYLRTDTYLTRDGKLYARHTEFVHSWRGIQYPDSNPHWRCPSRDQRISGKNGPSESYEKQSIQYPAPILLINLLFK